MGRVPDPETLHIFIHRPGPSIYPGLDPKCLVIGKGGGGTEGLKLGGGVNPSLIIFKIYVSENTFQAILSPIFPYSILGTAVRSQP